MSLEDIVKAWRDEEYRASLPAEQQATLPASPIGEIELTDADLAEVEGGSPVAVSIAVTTLVTEASIAASVSLCPSIAAGGTCQVDTSGCCPAAD